MAFGDVTLTVVGNLAGDPELRFTQSGAAVCNFTIAKNKRRKNNQTNQWEDAGTDWYRVNVWRQLAENVTESLCKGDRVIVQGRLESRDFETREGEKRTVWEITADSVGPELSWATAQVRKADRQFGNGQGGQQGYQQGPPADDPWGSPPQQQQPQQQQRPPQQHYQGYNPNDPWASTPAPAGQSGFSDEPPF